MLCAYLTLLAPPSHHSLSLSLLRLPLPSTSSSRQRRRPRPSSGLLLRRLLLLLRLNRLDIPLNLIRRQHLHGLSRRHDGDLNVLGPRLHDLQQRFDGQRDGGFAVQVVFVVTLEEFADGFGGAADGVGFPVYCPVG